MKFTYNWLCRHIETNLTPLQIKDALIDLGLEVEEYTNYQEKFEGFTVAYIKDAVKHPNADSLQVCQVEIGENKVREIVCGAHNARKGIKVVFADEGMYIPGTDITLKKASIRGVESSGMMLSERELTLSDDHDGIIELPLDAKVGEGILPYMGLDDVIYDVSITLNRAYALGVRGIARDLVAFGKGKLKPLDIKGVARTLEDSINLTADENICTYFNAVLVKNVENKTAKLPDFITNSLKMIGVKLNSPLVDLANYLTIDLNQPFHIYDYDKVSSNISVRFAKSKEKIKCLDDKEYELEQNIPLICKDGTPVCIAGVMGGLDCSCTEDTKNILVECAHFESDVILSSASKLGISSEASYRYSRFVDKTKMEDNLNILLSYIKDTCQGEFSKTSVFGSAKVEENTIELDLTYFAKLTSLSLSKSEVTNLLQVLEFEVQEKDENTLLVKAPSYRFDIQTQNCIIEEAVRLYGFDNIESKPLKDAKPCIAFKNHKEADLNQDLAYILANKGLQEVLGMSFIPQDLAKTLGIYDEKLELFNPISANLALMRKSIVPSLLLTYLSNYNKGKNSLHIFEAGDVYDFNLKDKQELQLACLLSGKNKQNDALEKARNVDVYDVKALLFEALNELGVSPSKLTYKTDDLPPYYHGSKSAMVGFGFKNMVACFGQLHPAVKQKLGIKEDIMLFELYTERLAKFVKAGKQSPFVENNLMPLSRDFAFVLNDDVQALQLIKIAKSASKLITDVKIFDIYKGDNLEEGKKSVAFSITIQPKDQSLKGEEIEKICNTIIKDVEGKLQGQLRG